jgi:uncharacterized protein DUF6636
VIAGAAAVAAAAALTLAPSAASVGGLQHFQSPSGNINCIGGPAFQGSPAFVECLVQKHTWPAKITPRKPAACDLDFDPFTIALGHRKTTVGSCRGDIGPLCVQKFATERCSTLAYGKSVTMGPIRCTSLQAGMECRYTTAPHVGFRIARETYVLYRS